MSFVKTFKEDGITSDKVLPLVEKKKEKNRLYIRFIALLLLSNCFTFLLFSSKESPIPSGEVSVIEAPDGYIQMVLPLSLHIPLSNTLNAVTIIDSNDKVICSKAYMVNEAATKTTAFEEDLINSYRVFIHKNDIAQLMRKSDLKLRAYPYTTHFSSSKRRRTYEVHF